MFSAHIRGAFDAHEFDFLENQGRQFRESRELLADGGWKLTHFYAAVGNRFHHGDAGYLSDLDTFAAWERAYPESTTRRVALADFLIAYAWHARGTGDAHTVTQEGWRHFGKRLSHAWTILQTLRQGGEHDPYSYAIAVKAAMGLSLDASELETIIAEHRNHFPDYYPTEVRRAYSLLPRWLGKDGDWEAFALAATQVDGGLGDETYVRILMYMKRFYANIFRDSKAVWPPAKRGLIRLNAKYPNAVEIQHYTAYFAVLAKDRALATEYFEQLGDAYMKTVWKKPERFVHCRNWARTGRW